MNLIFDQLPPDHALETQQLARLMYETREHRREVLEAAGAATEDELLGRIARGEIAEHPAYEQYLAARILADTHQAARAAIAHALKEANR